MGSQRVRHNLATERQQHNIYILTHKDMMTLYVLRGWCAQLQTGFSESVMHAANNLSGICSGVLVAVHGGYQRLWGYLVWSVNAALWVFTNKGHVPGAFSACWSCERCIKKAENHHAVALWLRLESEWTWRALLGGGRSLVFQQRTSAG